jgi:DNA-binding transcriptional regulator YhcF (GntR family)
MRQGAGTFVREVENQRRTEERSAEAARLVRAMLAEAARLGLATDDLVTAFKHEVGASDR